jgi:SpoVK/Ycf46/Vps4 family AAA+-type ATPase
VGRVAEQPTVFGEWGFLAGRAGHRGLRLLFCGPPGTGKTLAAEVIAGELGRDLLVVDLSQMVSKWIGETEKNLAAAFAAAERGGAVLFFDEADALFGKRTEVGDARDRYANLETAYLLSRLERFDGVAVLATNLRQNLDAAFARRIEFIVPFDLPDATERELLWRRHLPAGAPLAPSVDCARLAAIYALPGALIRNAAVAAAFLAASERSSEPPREPLITLRHLVHAVRREYVKAGQAFPGAPSGVPA